MNRGSNQIEVVLHFYVRKCSHIKESGLGLGGRVSKMFVLDCREEGGSAHGKYSFFFKVLSFNLP